jgi:hypothetical protein
MPTPGMTMQWWEVLARFDFGGGCVSVCAEKQRLDLQDGQVRWRRIDQHA